MFESVVVTLREGVEAALIIAIVLAYLKKIERAELVRSAYAGLAAGVAFSLASAILFRRFEISQEHFEGWTMLAGSIFVATMVIWMWRTARRLKGEIETRVGQIASRSHGQFSLGIFAFVLLMILREGIETVLFLGAVELNTTAMMSLIGGIIGLMLAVVFGLLFIKGAIRVDLRKFFSITSVILLIVAAQLFISGLHELSEAMVLPSSEREMAIIGPIVKNRAFFYIVILALTAFMVITQRQQPVLTPGASPAERRKALYRARKERLLTHSLAALALASIAMIAAQFVYSVKAGALSPPEEYFDQGQDVRLPIARVSDGKLHRFAYRAGDRIVRFLLIRVGTGAHIAAALDACQICGDKGYFQQGAEIICKNCTAPINPASIGQSGGCNPIPIRSQVEGQYVIIPASELDGAAKYFIASQSH
jgi:high-affinity iron transporter